MSFTALLIQRCTIQSKTLASSGYEKVKSWSNLLTDVPTRKDSDNGARISDADMRINTDDDIFFFDPSIAIKRGHRIILDNENYDVIKVNKCYDSTGVHHLEVVARFTDHD